MSKISRRGLRITAAAAGAGVIVAAAWAVTAHAVGGHGGAAHAGTADAAMSPMTSGPVSYQFAALGDQQDPTFNQLLGISRDGTIAGYFGSGAAGHPNKGYLLFPPYGQGNYVNENFPGSVQTQLTGLNDKGTKVGFYSTMNNANMMNDNHGFWQRDGRYHSADFPAGSPASPPVDQLLGVNDGDVAVGFWTDAAGNNHGYELNIAAGKFSSVTDPNAPGASLTAAAINSGGGIAGFYVNPATKATDGFLKSGGKFTDLAVPGASATTALGVNDHGEVVGGYTVGSGDNAVMHGFTWTPGGGFTTVDDPQGMGTTTINGVNGAGDLVGFYTDPAGNTDGFLATPFRAHRVTTRVRLAPMPQGTAAFSWDSNGAVDVTLDASGLTPGSSHTVELVNGNGQVVTTFGPLTANSAGQAQGETLHSGYQGTLGSWRVVVLGGTAGDQVSAEPIARTGKYHSGQDTYQLTAVEAGADGHGYGTPQGSAVVSYDPSAQTISVTVNASGLTPGAHAAHIHVGSCASQGPVQYMLMDFTANADGQIANQTRVVSHVVTPLPASGWYLNLHQGNGGDIVANGSPTINFRPLLCGDIVTQGS
jgi:Cu/Zn superoxide dismutase